MKMYDFMMKERDEGRRRIHVFPSMPGQNGFSEESKDRKAFIKAPPSFFTLQNTTPRNEVSNAFVPLSLCRA